MIRFKFNVLMMVSPIELFSNEETFQETTQKKEGIRKQSEG